jgi:hypothetical protein
VSREVAESASKWLKSLHLAHTLCKEGIGWRLELAPAALRKKVLYTCSVQPVEGGSCISLDCSSKLGLRDWLLTLPRHATHPLLTCRSVSSTP